MCAPGTRKIFVREFIKNDFATQSCLREKEDGLFKNMSQTAVIKIVSPTHFSQNLTYPNLHAYIFKSECSNFLKTIYREY